MPDSPRPEWTCSIKQERTRTSITSLDHTSLLPNTAAKMLFTISLASPLNPSRIAIVAGCVRVPLSVWGSDIDGSESAGSSPTGEPGIALGRK